MNATREDRGGRDDPTGGAFRWECPTCSASEEAVPGEWGRNALRGLKVHVYYSAGDGHGDPRSYPDEFPEAVLSRYVGPADASGERGPGLGEGEGR